IYCIHKTVSKMFQAKILKSYIQGSVYTRSKYNQVLYSFIYSSAIAAQVSAAPLSFCQRITVCCFSFQLSGSRTCAITSCKAAVSLSFNNQPALCSAIRSPTAPIGLAITGTPTDQSSVRVWHQVSGQMDRIAPQW